MAFFLERTSTPIPLAAYGEKVAEESDPADDEMQDEGSLLLLRPCPIGGYLLDPLTFRFKLNAGLWNDAGTLWGWGL